MTPLLVLPAHDSCSFWFPESMEGTQIRGAGHCRCLCGVLGVAFLPAVLVRGLVMGAAIPRTGCARPVRIHRFAGRKSAEDLGRVDAFGICNKRSHDLLFL